MTPAILACISVPLLVIGSTVVAVNFFKTSKKMLAGEIDELHRRAVTHIAGAAAMVLGGFGSAVSLIWYIVLSVLSVVTK